MKPRVLESVQSQVMEELVVVGERDVEIPVGPLELEGRVAVYLRPRLLNLVEKTMPSHIPPRHH